MCPQHVASLLRESVPGPAASACSQPGRSMPVVAFPPSTLTRHRWRVAAALAVLAFACGLAQAQMGAGHGGGRGKGVQQDASDKPKADCPKAESVSTTDLMAAFAARLKEGPPELALTPQQLPAFRDFVDSAVEVGQHDERWIQKTASLSTGTVSATEPIGAFVGSELGDSDDRQQALQDLHARYDALQRLLTEGQRAVLGNLFVATRNDLRAGLSR
jgi:hypothetical protein